MGLDMYLSARYPAPPGSPLRAAVEAGFATREGAFQRLLDHGGSTFLTGNYSWEVDKGEPHPDWYEPLARLTAEPDPESPHFDVACADGVITVEPNIAYWRKANAVHAWFVDGPGGGVDDCQRIEVNAEHLADLAERCERVVADHDLAEELLPTRGGFFFGGTEFDDWYFEQAEYTARRLRAVVPTLTGAEAITYQASW